MGGGKRRPMNYNNKSKPRKQNQQSLFVEGGILGGCFDSPPSSTSRLGKNQNMRSGNSANGSSSNSKNGGKKSQANSFRYEYPPVDFKDVLQSEPGTGKHKEEGNSTGLQPVILLGKDSKIVAFEDHAPSMGPSKVEYHYEYSSGFTLGENSHSGSGFSDEGEEEDEEVEQLHRGLGFSDQQEIVASAVLSSTSVQEIEESSDDSLSQDIEEDDDAEDFMDEVERENVDEDEDDSNLVHESPIKTPSGKKNSAFVSIGGVKLYTEDISDEENDDYEDSSDEGSSSESSESDDSEGSSNFDSDIDDDVMEDYLDGIGGSSQILKSKWLASHDLNGNMKANDDSSSDEYGKTLKKLSGVALQEASREYGMRKQQSKKNPPAKSQKAKTPEVAWSSALDDLMLVKDPRRRPAKKKHVAQISQSWPSKGRKSKNYGRFPGEKKKYRKEAIAVKRRERMLRRGADLEQINSKLKQMVLGNTDILSFPPMHTRDCSQVQRLAAIYRLKSGSLGSGKKRFVTVSRTQHTSMPSASDEKRLEKLIGSSKDDADFPVVNTPQNARNGSARSKTSKNSANNQGSNSKSGKTRSVTKPGAYKEPVSFVPSGIIHSEVVEVSSVEPIDNDQGSKAAGNASPSIGSFEVHTKGFGSKMMAKMGYVEGEGLGKDGKGMSQPIEVVQRPKSLGLGMSFVESSSETVIIANPKSSGKSKKKSTPNIGAFHKQTKGFVESNNEAVIIAKTSGGGSARKSTPNIGSFERHTKGFGSKMMARMGFVDGMGLGRDSQGIVTPLTAVRRPKARGLGAEDRR